MVPNSVVAEYRFVLELREMDAVWEYREPRIVFGCG